jgi:hypothetical protein
MSYVKTIKPTKLEPNTTQLWDMLQTMRPANSKTEERFIRTYLDSVYGMKADAYGNRYIKLGDSCVAWSCHTDTVHSQHGKQRIVYNKNKGTIHLSQSETNASCLGADDTAGVWLMLEMIRANKPGLYIFHRAEEIGGLGSDYIAKKTPELLDGIKAIIALDRKGTSSIITHQMGGRCASEAFSESLANQLIGYRSDSTGTFTDSANYMGLVSECSNLSVGYESAHSKAESLDYFHLLALRESLLALDYSKLAFERIPETEDYWDYGPSEHWDWQKPKADGAYHKASQYDCRSVYDFVESYPDAVADLLEQYGITLDELYQSAPWLN